MKWGWGPKGTILFGGRGRPETVGAEDEVLLLSTSSVLASSLFLFGPREGVIRAACGPGRRNATAAARWSGDGRWPGTVAARRTSLRLPAGSVRRHAVAVRRASGAKPRPRSP